MKRYEEFHESKFLYNYSKEIEILGEATSGFTLKLVPQLRTPNQSEWFEIMIEPDVVKPTSIYRISVVYRSKDKSKVEKFTQDMMQILMGIIDIIER